jgi:hypothetical protein
MGRGKGLYRIVVVAVTAATLMLMAAIGVSAAAGTFGSARVLNSVGALFSPSSVGVRGNDKCEGDGDHHEKGTPGHENGTPGHENGTPGHENDPCDDD